MDFIKLKSLLPKELAIDIKPEADTVRVTNKMGDDNSWLEFTPSKYKNEEELTLTIKAHLNQKQDRI